MRIVRLAVLVGLLVKSVLLGTLLWGSFAQAGGEGRDTSTLAAAEDKQASEVLPVAPEQLARARGFRTLLESVAARGADLEAREKTLALREDTLHALEKLVGEQVARLEGALKTMAPKGAARAGAPGSGAVGAAPPTSALSKIYESMKAEEAAPILEKMDDAIVKEIVAPMKEKQIGAILAAMNRDRAVAITKLLAAAASGHGSETAARR